MSSSIYECCKCKRHVLVISGIDGKVTIINGYEVDGKVVCNRCVAQGHSSGFDSHHSD